MAAATPALKPERARPRANILRRSFVAQDLITRAGAAAEFDELLDRLWDEIQPQGALEIAAFNDLLRARWNIERLQGTGYSVPRPRSGRVDRAACPRPQGALEFAPVQNEATACALWQRAFHRALSELRRLQTAATLRMKLDAEPEVRLTPLASGATALLQPDELRKLAFKATLRESRLDYVTALEDCAYDQLPNEAKRFINRGV